ncbi:MAG: hypothetical protein Q9210_002067 [Variospora velana]
MESDEESEEDTPIAARAIFPEDFAFAMAAGQPTAKEGTKRILTRPSGVQKSKGKQRETLQQQIDDLQQQAEGEESTGEVEDIEIENEDDEDKENEPAYPQQRPNSGRNSSSNAMNDPSGATRSNALLRTRVSKTGKVQELVADKPPKIPDPIKAMVGRDRFNINKIFDMPVTMPLGELLNRSDTMIKELAYYMQRATPRYRVKKASTKPTKATTDATQAQPQQASAVMAAAALLPPPVTAFAYDDDGQSVPLMITSWVGDQKLTKSLLEGGSLVELISKKKLNKLDPRPKIYGMDTSG